MDIESFDSENLIFHHMQLKILKRENCPWCKSLLQNVEYIKEMFLNQGISSKLLNQMICIQDKLVGKVPEIFIRINFPHSSEYNYIFKYDNEDRTCNSLMTTFLYFATIIYPETYWRTKYSSDLLDYLTRTFYLKNSYLNEFISLQQVQSQILDLRNTSVLMDKNDSIPLITDNILNDLYQLDDLDIITLFYYINQVYTKKELLKNISSNTNIINQLANEEIRFRMIKTNKNLTIGTTESNSSTFSSSSISTSSLTSLTT